MPTEPRDERYRPWGLIGVTLIALLGFAVFFLSFLVAPLAILLIFYVGFAASDRTKRKAKPPADASAKASASGGDEATVPDHAATAPAPAPAFRRRL